MELLRRHDVALEGAEAVVVGRSDLVGKPLAALLLAANATVTTCHSRTRDLAEVCRRADVLVAAVGRPEFVQGDWIKEGATVIDVGHQPHRGRPRRRRRLRGGRRARRADHARPGRRGADDDRDAAAQHAAGGEGAGGLMRRPGRRRRRGRRGRPCCSLSTFLEWYTVRGRADGLTAWGAFTRRRPARRPRGRARDRARRQPGRGPRAGAAGRARRDHHDARPGRHAARALPDPQPARAQRRDRRRRRGLDRPRRLRWACSSAPGCRSATSGRGPSDPAPPEPERRPTPARS